MTDKPGLQDLLFNDEEAVWTRIRLELSNSNCVKTQTAAAIVRYDQSSGKYRVFSFGSNSCAPDRVSYSSKISVCPRAKVKTGSNYELCAPIHAERMACLNIRHYSTTEDLLRFASHLPISEEEILSTFNHDELKVLEGASLYLVGHYWACEGCVSFLNTLGITDIQFDSVTGVKTKERYSKLEIKK